MPRRTITYLNWLNHLYVSCVIGWAVMRRLFGDRWWWLFFLNTFAEYLFIPLPAMVGGAWLTKRRSAWAGFAAVLALGTYLYGRMWWPKLPASSGNQITLTIMTFNMLGYNQYPAGVVAAIRASSADVVAIQELNPQASTCIQQELATLYPYQALNPHDGDSGMGIISRFPVQNIDVALPGDWIGQPQVISLQLGETAVIVLHFHTCSTDIGSPAGMATVRARECQARVLADFASTRPEPVIALGDFNATDQGVAYATMTSVLADSWKEAGWGFGHTFPGAASTGSSRHRIAGILVPQWLLRIDYIFHSSHWQALRAWIGPWDEVSDHRSVLAYLALEGTQRYPS